jgi:hypothetical protein
MYTQGAADENYLRACRRPTPADASSSRASSRPYSGRWPHIHFEICPSLSRTAPALRSARNSLPQDT